MMLILIPMVFSLSISDSRLIGYWNLDDSGVPLLNNRDGGNTSFPSYNFTNSDGSPVYQTSPLTETSTSSVTFPGSDYVSIDSFTVAAGDSVSCFWVNYTDTANSIIFTTQQTSGGGGGVRIFANNPGIGQIKCLTGSDSVAEANLITGNIGLQDGVPHHMCVSRCDLGVNVNVTLWVDGSNQVSEITSDDSIGHSFLRLATRNTNYWDGTIDELVMLSGCATQTLITDIYTNGVVSGDSYSLPDNVSDADWIYPATDPDTDNQASVWLNWTDSTSSIGATLNYTLYINGTKEWSGLNTSQYQWSIPSEGHYLLRVDVHDNGTMVTGNERKYIYDVTSPAHGAWSSDISTDNSTITNKNSIWVNVTITDDNQVYAYNASILYKSNSSTLTYTNKTGLTGTSYRANISFDISSLPDGDYYFRLRSEDSHTKRAIRNYAVKKNKLENLEFDTGKYKIGITLLDIQAWDWRKGYYSRKSKKSLIKKFNAIKERDRYVFDLGTRITKNPYYNYEYTFLVTSPTEKIHIIKSKYVGHLIIGENWVDFEHEGKRSSWTERINDHQVIVHVYSDAETAEFRSLGGLNSLTETLEFTIDRTDPTVGVVYSAPSSPEYTYSQTWSFSDEATDTNGISKAIIEFDSVNYTMSFLSGNTYSKSGITGSWPVGTPIPYVFFANDTVGNMGRSITRTFNISQGDPNLSITINGTGLWKINNGTSVKVNASGAKGTNPSLKRNGTMVSNPDNFNSPTVGIYNYTYWAGTINWTNTTYSQVLNVTADVFGDQPPVMLSVRIYSDTNTTLSDLQGYAKATDYNGDNVSYEYKLFKNGVLYEEALSDNASMIHYQETANYEFTYPDNYYPYCWMPAPNGGTNLYDGDWSTWGHSQNLCSYSTYVSNGYPNPQTNLFYPLLQYRDDSGTSNLTTYDTTINNATVTVRASDSSDRIFYTTNFGSWHHPSGDTIPSVAEIGMWWRRMIYEQSTEQNIVTISSTDINLNDIIILSARATDGKNYSAWMNSSALEVVGANFSSCDSGNVVLSVYGRDEDAPSSALGIDVELSGSVWLDNSSEYTNFSFGLSGNDTYNFCLFPDTASNAYADAYFKYNSSAFTHRYYLFNQSFNNASVLSLYLYDFVSGSGKSDFSLTVREWDTYNYFSDAVGHLERFYPSENTWRVVQMDKTGSYGNLFFNIREEDTDYRVKFFDVHNRLLDSTDQMKLVCTSGLCELTFLLDAYSSSASPDFIQSFSYDNNTKNLTVTFGDSLGLTHSARLLVQKYKGAHTITICNETVMGSSGSMTCDLSGYDGSVLARIYSSASPETPKFAEWLSLGAASIYEIRGNVEGAFWSFLILLVTVGFGVMLGGAGIVVGLFVGILAVYLLGLFSPVTLTFVIIVVVLGLILAVKVRRNG